MKKGVVFNQTPRDRQGNIYCPSSRSYLIIESNPEGKDSRISFERNSERAFESFYDAKRTYLPNN
jgi:hypothetical protein